MQRKISIATYIVFFIFIIFLLKLWYLQVVKGREYKEIAEKNRLRTIEIPAPRGIIYDRNHRPLVKNIPSFDISVVREDLPRDTKTLSRLARLLHLSYEDILESLQKSTMEPLETVKLKQDVSLQEAARVGARRIDFPGLRLEVVVSREYIYGEYLSHVLGYLGQLTLEQMRDPDYSDVPRRAFIGQMGIEKVYDKILRGVAGKKIIEIDAIGRIIKVVDIQKPVKGRDIELTIDIDLQIEAERALEGKRGAIVAVDPNTGEVLALASSPSFDPNLFARGIDYSDWKRLVNDPGKPFLNRAIQSQYAPGSIFKIITAIAALEEGIIDETTRINCTGAFLLGRWFRCWKEEGHGYIDLYRAIVESCDVYFYEIGERLGIDKLAEYATAFWLGKLTGIELEGEKSGIVPSISWKLRTMNQQWFPGETLNTAIGQGYLSITPIQAARLISTIINGGIIHRLHLLKDSNNNDYVEDVIKIRRENLEIIKKALIGVVSESRGTGWMARSDLVSIGGKTGTVQVVSGMQESEDHPEEYRDHAWFVAFAPVKNPVIAVAVFIEHGGHGSTAAAPIAKRIIEVFIKKIQEPKIKS
jgi:penicillin-binding protein 2